MEDDERSLFLSIIMAILFVFTAEYPYYSGGVTVFEGDISQDTAFQIDLIRDRRYEVWVVDTAGPETVDVSIRKGQDIVYEESFRLLHPEGDYIPWHPCVWATDTDTYDVHVHPRGAGTVKILIRKDAGQNSSPDSCPILHPAGQG